MTDTTNEIAIIGAGIAGLTLGLCLYQKGIAHRIYENAPEISPLGVGINVLPHATRILHDLGVGEALAAVGIQTREAAFFNRFGQEIYTEPLGVTAGYETPQYSIHRGDLQMALCDAYIGRAGADQLVTDAGCRGFEQDAEGVRINLVRTSTGEALPQVKARAVIGCDGIHSVIRKQIHPDDGDPRYSGYNMWRGVTVCKPVLSGATMVRAGWLATGKMVIYPIRDNVDGEGSQLMNWVAEIETPITKDKRDWNKPGRLEDVLPAFADWHFDWLDVPDMIKRSDVILEFPMVDQDPLDFWTEGRVTLMGDAAHPMVPRGSNGAGQSVVDAWSMADLLARSDDIETVFKAFETERLDTTSRIVLTNRVSPPDIVLKEVFDRTGDKPFDNIDDVITADELAGFQQRYKEVAGYDLKTLMEKSAVL
jgi:2-polyprenyl-6-methoxyphenol hydroxylase-like FAD-dependent oxidoreductase